jgi:hypothetical protein
MKHNAYRAALIRVSKIHVLIGLIFVVQIIVYDAGKLITPEVVLKRWLMTGLLILVASLCWFLARTKQESILAHKLVWTLVATDLILGSFYTYTQRGMASRAVILFVLPILTAAILRRKGTIYLAAVTSAVVYVVTAIAYFVLNFNEGYKLELYGEIGFYSALLFAVAGLTWALVRPKR